MTFGPTVYTPMLGSLAARLAGHPNSSQCHAAEYCGEPGDVHTNERWWLDREERDAVIGLVKAASHLCATESDSSAIDPKYMTGVPKRVLQFLQAALDECVDHKEV